MPNTMMNQIAVTFCAVSIASMFYASFPSSEKQTGTLREKTEYAGLLLLRFIRPPCHVKATFPAHYPALGLTGAPVLTLQLAHNLFDVRTHARISDLARVVAIASSASYA